MPKALNISVVTMFFVLGLFSFGFSEDITITTYYPSPYGSYVELRANQMSVGSGYTGAALANGNLLVESRVGIGLISPFYRLEVGETSEAANYIRVRSDTTGWGGLMFYDGQGSASGSVYYEHATDSLLFQTRNASTALADRMRLNSAGYLGIGLSMITGQAINPGHLIELIGGAYCDGTADWMTGSDRAYKKDIDYNFRYGLKAVERLRPVYYIHKQDKTNKKQIGFIAQDVKEIVPELVGGEEGSYGLSYGQLSAVLVNAIKEQQSEI